ncbi:exonuclease SbcCD subunit D [Rhodococcus sp. BP-349]|uniref:exonuclease SbcCD subunit D n=1 Tax=unclassified Rhodococcus (in: high G+C Gram-positive bacteria) TaxID=192944 RepID=UPI001C9A3FE3|nr:MULTISPECIES: exonuclease SbcCD subunit D [unclassified Rhodococcus (in: high G+C Gram-positive bacteria)]MBY6538600.1 exonuclease SbcCD subunit D [Rhodococcus sp. BP-363]MBY6542937.1 exonuclease SbcCD subunit D [Rhodococcus sp. BP-369]MBY6562167.1 exonuclease SbcCD subunit D [Rhodococcus sp. BP-370]MBY6576459.1 exonuclease SbcCD subunit D [Rhodococcus sp. BP-364]MBY6585760.1 exonuclease SbcCD subunit D [Rhodococcus sp. BP-358]
MRILHTSDWHIGRTFHGVDLVADQRRALEALATVVREQSVDVVVIPGDIYDRAVPNADAVRLCNRAFEAIRDAGAVIVATSGNHDSPARLGAGSAFSAAGGLHLFTTVDAVDRPVVLADEHGDVAFYGIPYLEPDATRAELGVPAARSHAAVLQAAMSRIAADLATRDSSVRSVVLAHAFVIGGEGTGSERSISVGGVETVPASIFGDVDYVALGHLHSPQTIDDHIRYSGSPLPYSFGERSHRKAAWLVDIDGSGGRVVTRVDLPVVRGLSVLEGTLEELCTEGRFDSATAHYVSAVLTDAVRPVDAMRRLQERFPHAVHLEWKRPAGVDSGSYREKVQGRSDREVLTSFLADVRSAPSASEGDLLDRAVENVTGQRDSTSASPVEHEWVRSA